MRTGAAIAASLLLAAACGGDAQDQAGRSYVYGTEAQVLLPLPDSLVTEQGDVLSHALLSRGDSIYHGLRSRGTCSMCHGNHGRGGPIGRDFTDNEWGRIDGSYRRIHGLIIGGVDYDPPMPPRGGAPLSEEDVRAVAAYVYWLSRRDGHPLRPAEQPEPADIGEVDSAFGPGTQNGA
jgi:cytochrome c5